MIQAFAGFGPVIWAFRPTLEGRMTGTEPAGFLPLGAD